MELVPVTRDQARLFVNEEHRHNIAPQAMSVIFQVGVAEEGDLVGVAIGGRPAARALCDGMTLEVLRTCTRGAKNANSMLYGACARAAKALGYLRLVTYTLADEPGSSLKAAGWVRDADLPERPTWDTPSRHRVQTDLFGDERRPSGPKTRWVLDLATRRG